MLINNSEYRTLTCCVLLMLTTIVANRASGVLAMEEGQVEDQSTEEMQDWRQPLPTVSTTIVCSEKRRDCWLSTQSAWRAQSINVVLEWGMPLWPLFLVKIFIFISPLCHDFKTTFPLFGLSSIKLGMTFGCWLILQTEREMARGQDFFFFICSFSIGQSSVHRSNGPCRYSTNWWWWHTVPTPKRNKINSDCTAGDSNRPIPIKSIRNWIRSPRFRPKFPTTITTNNRKLLPFHKLFRT